MPKACVGRPKEIIRDAPNNLTNSELETPKPKLEVAKDLGFSKDQVSQFQTLADIQKPYKTLSQNLQKPAFLSGVFFYRRFSEKLKKSASVIIAYPKAGLNIPMPHFISGGVLCFYIPCLK